MSPIPPRRSTRVRTVVLLVLLAIAARALVAGLSLWMADASLGELAALHDGDEYQAVAAAVASPEVMRSLSERQRRLGPGYPAMVRLLSLAVPMPLAALAVAIAGAAAAVALLLRLGVDPPTVTVFAVFTPSWLVFTSTAMSEGPFLALALWGLLEWRRERRVAAAVVLGVATLVRPVGLLVFLPLWALELARRGWRERVGELVAYAALPGIWSAVSLGVWHDPAQQVTSYVTKDLAWPLASIAAHLIDPMRDPLKLAQVTFTLVLAGAAFLALRRRYRADADRADLQWLVWLAAQGAFYLVLPSTWAFECLPRFFVTCLPPILVGIGPHLPRRWWFPVAVAAGSIAVCVYWTTRALAG